ncbi:MAG: hypothetical protein CVV27_07070, partial [Candidatus Melainabacteria bacterium HGW-Melainabacteria-1]
MKRKWPALLAAFCLLNWSAAALARDTHIVSPPVAGAADPMTIRKAFRLESDPLVSLVHRDVPVEFVLRGLAQKANLSLIYMVDGSSGGAAVAARPAASGGEEDPLLELEQEINDIAPAASAGGGGGGRNLTIPYLELKNVPVSEAFALVLQMSGLTGRRVYNSLLITTPEKMNQMGFSAPVIKSYTIYNMASTAAVSTGGGAAGGAGAAAGNIPCMGGGIGNAAAPVVAAAGPPIAGQLMCMFQSRGISPMPRLMLDGRTSTLIVIGTQEAIDIADQMIPVLDRPLPQVVVEIKMIELSKSASQELGVSYGFAQDKTGASFNNSDITNRGPGTPLTSDGESVITFNSLSRFAPNFNVRLNALIRNRQARVLTSPRLTIQHGVPARFDSTTQFPVLSTTSTATTTTQTVTSIPIGEQLEITPFIDTEKDMITMRLLPRIS